MKQVLFMLLVLFGSISLTYGQRTVSGKVTDAAGEAVIGANVFVKESTSVGTITDVDGMYELSVPSGGSTLVFSYIGYETQEIAIGNSNVINAVIAAGQLLDEVVVTGPLGVNRDKKALGYATQEVKGDEIANMKQQNFVNSLSGRVAGMQIKQNNNFGGSTNINIRGNNSLLGNNQPLFVVDGVPVSNYSGNSSAQRNGGYGYDYGNAASDINPNDIENINVLKGAAATALYGSRGANGVIIINTKKGSKKKGLGISVSSSLNFGKINKSTFITYQDKYGAGYGPYYGETGEFDEADIDGDGVLDYVVPTYEDASYGGVFSPDKLVYQWESFVPESPNFGKKLPYVAAKNTPVDFFETQVTNNNTIEFNGTNDKGIFRLAYTNFNDKGILPNSKLTKHNIAFNGSYNLTDRLTSSISANYINQAVIGRNSTGYSDNLMTNFRQWWQTNVDIVRQRELYEQTGRNVTWNMKNPIGGETNPIFWDNPYWTRYKNYQSDDRDRIYGNVALNYKLTDWLSVMGRVSTDRFNEIREERRAAGSVPLTFGLQGNDEESGYQLTNIGRFENNFDLMFNYNTKLTDLISLTGVFGTNVRKESTTRLTQSTTGGLAVPGLYAIGNSKNTPPKPLESLLRKQVNGYYASASFGFDNTYFLDLSDRYDVSSALPNGNNAYNYYAVSGSVIFSNWINSDAFNFGKLRIGYAEVGNDTDPLNVYDIYNRGDNFGGAILTSVPSTKNNPALRPERTKSLEAGVELKFLNNRLGLDLSVYKNNTVDQILAVSQSTATGFSNRYVNAGELQNKGVEVSLSYAPIKTTDFTWNVVLNWARNRNTVVDLYADVQNIQLASYQGGVTLNATKGELYGTIRGTGFKYLNGQKVVGANGYYIAEADQVIGTAQADWTGGLFNSFTYKGVTLGFLVDVSQGGELYSLDLHYGQGTGLPDYTGGKNDLGNDLRLPLAEGGGLIFPGVLADGTPNTKRVAATNYGQYYYWGNAARNPGSLTVYDASFIKLRELSIAFNLPKTFVNKFANNIAFSLYGRNLFIKKDVPFADPESGLGAGNAQGYLSGAYPTVRSFGASIKVDF